MPSVDVKHPTNQYNQKSFNHILRLEAKSNNQKDSHLPQFMKALIEVSLYTELNNEIR